MSANLIIDAHTHIFPDHVAQRAVDRLGSTYGVAPVAPATRDGLLRHMDECGVDRSVLAPVSTKPEQVPGINEWITNLDTERLIPFGTLHPFYGDCAGEIEKLLDRGVRGFKLQPYFQGYDFEAPEFRAMMELVGDRLVVLLHGGQEMVPIEPLIPTPERVAALHRDFPQVRLIVAHLGGFQVWDAVEQHLVGRDVFFDLSYTFGHIGDEQLRRIVAAHGTEHLVWGSDFPWQSQAEALAGLRALSLPPEQEAAVLSGNWLRLTGATA